MNKPAAVNIIWFKRDLRLQDHAPLAHALKEGLPVLLLYCFEPSLMAAPSSELRHWRFVYESLQDLQAQLQPSGHRIYWVHAEVIPTLEQLAAEVPIRAIYSHAEVGIKLTFDRDRAVKRWCAERGVKYQTFPQDGVIRGRKHRRNWAEQLEQDYFTAPQQHVELARLASLDLPVKVQQAWAQQVLPADIQQYQPGFQQGGERMAWRYLHSFFQDRGQQYSRNLSKPAASRHSCSRLSPYLAFGCISARAVMQHLATRPLNEREQWNLDNFRSRVWWRSHFIQKLESDWRIEVQAINPVFESLDRLPGGPVLEAWASGQTGFPMVDAAMRCLQANGWINFRMRAMLVSFATFALDLDWRPVATHLATLFLDFEPGIHYSQIQMQAGLTGYHTLRIYNPSVQVQEHDPDGAFIKKWVPALQQVPPEHLAEPWKMTPLEQSFYHCQIGQDYPAPLVDFGTATARNKAKYWALRESAAAKAALPQIMETFCMPKDIEKYQQQAAAPNPSE